MADNIEIGFKMPGLETITKNTEQLNNQLQKAKLVADKIGIDSSNVQTVKQLATSLDKVAQSASKLDNELKDVDNSLEDVKDSADEMNQELDKSGNISQKSFGRLRGALKDVSKSIAETGADALNFGDDLASNVSSVGDSIAGLVSGFGLAGVAAGLAISALTPFVAELFELSDAEKQAEADLEAYNERLIEFSNLLVDSLGDFNNLAQGLQEGFDLQNLNRQNEFLKEFITLTLQLAKAQQSGNEAQIASAEQALKGYQARRDAAIEEERNNRLNAKLNEDVIKAEQERLNQFTVSAAKKAEIEKENNKDAEKAEKDKDDAQKKALSERKQREDKALQERIAGINKINSELDKEIKKLDDLSKNGSVNEVKEQQEKVLEVQERQIKAIDDAVNATKNYIEVSKTLKDLREQDAENDRKRGLVQEEIQLKNAIEERSKAEIKALQDIVDQSKDGADNIFDLLGIDKDNAEAVQLLDDITSEFGVTAEAIQKLRDVGATFGDGFLSGTTLSDLIARLRKVQGALGDIPDKAKDAATNANKNITERFIQGAKEANAAYFETLGRVDPELTKAGVKSFEQSLRFLIDERNNTAAKLINEKQGILTKFNTLFDTKALRIEDEKLLVDEQALIEARAKLTTEAELKAFDDQQSALLEVIKLANDGKQALDINFLIARNKLQITYNDEYIAAYKKRFDDESRIAQLEYDEATFAQEQFTSKELDDLKKSNDERKKLKKKQTKEDKDNILFAKQEALTLLERQFDEENELLQKQQLDPLNALRAKLEDATLDPEEKAAIAKKIELQQREAELAIAKAQTNQSKKRTAVSQSFDNLIEEDKAETQKRIKEITEIAQASQQLIGQVFEFAIQQNQNYLDLLNEQLSGIDEQISNTQGKITELEDDLEGKRSGRRDAVLQSIELEKQREIDLANQKIALEKKIAEEQRKIRIKEQAAAIAQALINGALSITAITTVPDFTFGIASAIRIGLVAASTAAQVATIASQKFAKGGILQGNSHSQGGIQTPFGELEGGEAVINKNSTRMFAPLLSQINEAGGGKRFATGGILDTQSLNQNSNSASGKDVVGLASMNQMNQQLMALQNRPIYVRPTEVTNLAASTARMVQSVMI